MKSGRSWQRRWILFLAVAPIVFVLGAFVWLSFAHGTPFLWNEVIHEGGHYTFGGTVLFARHHLREIPVDIVMSLALAAAISTVAPTGSSIRLRWPMWVAVGIVTTALAASAAEEGPREAIRDLFQFRTRDDDVRYGSHWHFHLLSTIWFACAAPLLAAITTGSARLLRPEGRARALLMATWLVIISLTMVFGVTLEPFTSARYIGHQAREILTHGLITLPLVFALGVSRTGAVVPDEGRRASLLPSVIAWIVVAGIPFFLVIAFSGSGLEGTAQLSSGMSGIVAGHVFEHMLDYIVVALLTLALIGKKVTDPASRAERMSTS